MSELGIEYTAPQENIDLRERIRIFLRKGENIDELVTTALRISLKFLEMGLMVDNFGKDEDGRHNFLLSNRVKLGDKEITLYELSKMVNKLTGNKISEIILLAQDINNEDIKKSGRRLMKKIKKIMIHKGYFKPRDLEKIDGLARNIIEYILRS